MAGRCLETPALKWPNSTELLNVLQRRSDVAITCRASQLPQHSDSVLLLTLVFARTVLHNRVSLPGNTGMLVGNNLR